MFRDTFCRAKRQAKHKELLCVVCDVSLDVLPRKTSSETYNGTKNEYDQEDA